MGLGRPFLYAQSAYGEKGVVRAVRSEFWLPSSFSCPMAGPWREALTVKPVMEQEIITAMRLLGVNKISDIKPEMVECLQELWK